MAGGHGQGGVSSVEDIRQGNSFPGTCAQARCPSASGPLRARAVSQVRTSTQVIQVLPRVWVSAYLLMPPQDTEHQRAHAPAQPFHSLIQQRPSATDLAPGPVPASRPLHPSARAPGGSLPVEVRSPRPQASARLPVRAVRAQASLSLIFSTIKETKSCIPGYLGDEIRSFMETPQHPCLISAADCCY